MLALPDSYVDMVRVPDHALVVLTGRPQIRKAGWGREGKRKNECLGT